MDRSDLRLMSDTLSGSFISPRVATAGDQPGASTEADEDAFEDQSRRFADARRDVVRLGRSLGTISEGLWWESSDGDDFDDGSIAAVTATNRRGTGVVDTLAVVMSRRSAPTASRGGPTRLAGQRRQTQAKLRQAHQESRRESNRASRCGQKAWRVLGAIWRVSSRPSTITCAFQGSSAPSSGAGGSRIPGIFGIRLFSLGSRVSDSTFA